MGTPWLNLQTVGGKLAPPDTRTIDVNFTAVLHSKSFLFSLGQVLTGDPACSLALHYLVPERETLTPDSVKALILIGSVGKQSFYSIISNQNIDIVFIAAFHPMYGTVQYTASKHAVLGIQRSISPVCTMKGIRSGSVHPGFVGKPRIHLY